MNKNSLKYTCLFGGGAIRGASYCGVVKALEELGVQTDNIAGSSVGSIVAALYAVGYNSDELKEIFNKVNFELFKDIQLGIGPKLAISKGEVFLEWIRELIESKYYGEKHKKGHNKAVTFKDLEKNLYIITTDLSNFECKEFSKQETADFEIARAVRISCGMPGLMRPIEYNNTTLVDGDLQKSWPMWKLSKNLLNNKERILELRLEGYAEDEGHMNPLSYANTVYSCITAMATSFIVDIYADKDKFDYIVVNTGDILIVDFNISRDKREHLMQMGYEQTLDYFKNILPEKKTKILENYKKLNYHFLKIKKLIAHNNISKAKIQLGELFTELPELFSIIDKADYNDIKNFRNIFLSNIGFPALFGKIFLKNEETVIAELNKVTNNISAKISELESYLSAYPA